MLPMHLFLGLVVDPLYLAAVLSVLEGNADEATGHAGQPEPLQPTALGHSRAGDDLGWHAARAHDEFRAGLEGLQKGLLGHIEALIDFRQRTGDIDDATADYMRRLHRNSDYIIRDPESES